MNISEEINILRELKHDPHIVRLQSVYSEANEKIHLVFDYAQCGSLTDYINKRTQPLQEKECKTIMRQLLLGVSEIHKHDFIHRDLKPSNVLVLQEGD